MKRTRKPGVRIHGLDPEGRVACNPRDREAAHRAAQGDLVTGLLPSITCRECRTRLHQRRRESASQPELRRPIDALATEA